MHIPNKYKFYCNIRKCCIDQNQIFCYIFGYIFGNLLLMNCFDNPKKVAYPFYLLLSIFHLEIHHYYYYLLINHSFDFINYYLFLTLIHKYSC